MAFLGKYDIKDYYYDYDTYGPKRDREYVDNLVSKREKIDKDWDRKFDFIFIDGHHSYESAIDHFEIAFELLNPGGCITFHDALSHQEVNDALEDLKTRYHGIARVDLYGSFDEKVFKYFNRSVDIDGIGFFKMLD